MNNYSEFNSKGSMIILALICTVFIVLVIRAFTYIPDNNSENIVSRNASSQVNINEQTVTNPIATEEKNVDINAQQMEMRKENLVQKENKLAADIKERQSELDRNLEELPQEVEMENISEDAANTNVPELTPEEKVMKIFVEAGKLKKEKQYVRAIEEFQKVSTATNDVDVIARSYEEIATVYAVVKRYGTALSYAQKAYNMSPSSSREMLLARLYYKTGDIDKATRRINNVLQRDFSADR